MEIWKCGVKLQLNCCHYNIIYLLISFFISNCLKSIRFETWIETFQAFKNNFKLYFRHSKTNKRHYLQRFVVFITCCIRSCSSAADSPRSPSFSELPAVVAEVSAAINTRGCSSSLRRLSIYQPSTLPFSSIAVRLLYETLCQFEESAMTRLANVPLLVNNREWCEVLPRYHIQ